MRYVLAQRVIDATVKAIRDLGYELNAVAYHSSPVSDGRSYQLTKPGSFAVALNFELRAGRSYVTFMSTEPKRDNPPKWMRAWLDGSLGESNNVFDDVQVDAFPAAVAEAIATYVEVSTLDCDDCITRRMDEDVCPYWPEFALEVGLVTTAKCPHKTVEYDMSDRVRKLVLKLSDEAEVVEMNDLGAEEVEASRKAMYQLIGELYAIAKEVRS